MNTFCKTSGIIAEEGKRRVRLVVDSSFRTVRQCYADDIRVAAPYLRHRLLDRDFQARNIRRLHAKPSEFSNQTENGLVSQ